jgi:hypothetical protein
MDPLMIICACTAYKLTKFTLSNDHFKNCPPIFISVFTVSCAMVQRKTKLTNQKKKKKILTVIRYRIVFKDWADNAQRMT